MAGRQRTTFAKLQRERARQEKQAAKRARRQGAEQPGERTDTPPSTIDPMAHPYGLYPEEIEAQRAAEAEARAAAEGDPESEPAEAEPA